MARDTSIVPGILFEFHNHKVIKDHHTCNIDVRNHLPVWISEAHVSHENRRVSNRSRIPSFNLTVFRRMKRIKSYSVIQIRFIKTGVKFRYYVVIIKRALHRIVNMILKRFTYTKVSGAIHSLPISYYAWGIYNTCSISDP